MQYGAIYIAHNPRDGESVYKVGKTTRSIPDRMAELTADTSNIGQYTAVASFVVFDVDSAELACHKRLRRYRIQDNREFFEVPLPRLVKIVQEQTAAYRVSDLVPEVEMSSNETAAPVEAAKLLQAEREEQSRAATKWDADLAQAKKQLAEWFNEIHNNALGLQQQLSDEKLLRCNIPDEPQQQTNFNYTHQRFWSFLVLSEFSGTPCQLRHSGLRGGTYDDVDLSNAISGTINVDKPYHTGGLKDVELLNWKEFDDGRVGELKVYGSIHDHPGAKKIGSKPIAELSIIATRFRYDDYDESFKTTEYSKSYFDPTEAMEVLTALLIKNLAKPQVDVRTVRGTHKPKYGRSRPKIYDSGEFDTSLLEE